MCREILVKLRNFICMLTLLVVMFAVGTQTYAANLRESDNEHKTVRLAYLISEGYQEGVTADALKQGFGYDYYQKLSYITGWKYEYVYGNFGELLKKLENGEIDMMGNLSYTPERAQKIFFGAEEMGRETFYFYAKADNIGNYAHGLQDFAGKKIGVNGASFQSKLLKEWIRKNNLSGTTVVEYDSKAQRYDGLNSGKVDLSVSTMLSHRDKQNADWISVLKLGDAPFYIGISKKRPDLLQQLNNAQRRLFAVEPDFNNSNYNKYMKGTAANGTNLMQDEKEWLKAHPVVKYGFMSDSAPYTWKDHNTGKLSGALAIFIDTLEKNYNVKTEGIAYDVPRDLIKALQDGKIDFMLPAFGSYWMAERDGLSNSMALAESNMLMLYDGKYRENLHKRVAVTNCNSFGTAYAMNYYANSKLVKCKDIPDACEALKDGRADCIIVQNVQYELLRKRFPSVRSLNIVPLPNKMEVKVATNFNPPLLGIINKAVTLVDRGMFEEAVAISIDIPTKFTWQEQVSHNIVTISFLLLAFIGLAAAGFIWYHRVTAEKEAILIQAKENAEEMLKKEQNLRKQLEEARHKAEHDSLTGLYNKGAFENLLDMYKNSRDIAILVVDFDDFKSVNDNFGHAVGDEALKYVADILKRSFRSSDFVYRIGGDEYAVVLTNIKSSQKDALASKLEDIQKLVAEAPASLPRISLSIGVAFSYRGSLEDAREVFRTADKALYSVKLKNKNGYCIAN